MRKIKIKGIGVFCLLSMFLIGVLCSCGEGEERVVERATENMQEETISETAENDKKVNEAESKFEITDVNDYAGYYGKNISELEEKTGQSLAQDGNSYMAEGGYISTDGNGTVIEILLLCNEMMEHQYSIRGIEGTDTFEEAIQKMENASYEECESENEYTKIYKDENDRLIEITQNSVTEVIVRYFGEEVYTAEIEENDEYYLTDTIASGKLYTEVRYAYIEKPYGEPIICVNCVIQNNSPENITFVASDYFSLDNAGVIKTATMNDYDYVEIAAGAKIVTDIKFVYPSNSNMDFYNMTMTIEDTLVSLADKPQSESEKNEFYGIYNRFDHANKKIVTKFGEEYHIIDILYIGDTPYIDEYDITLDENNMFKMGEAYYLWLPEERAIYSYDMTWEEIDEYQTPWVKN